jgi:hypothetical protein
MTKLQIVYHYTKLIAVVAVIFALTTIGVAVLKITPGVQNDVHVFGLLVDSARGTSLQLHKMAQAYGDEAEAQAKYTVIIEAKTATVLDDSDKAINRIDEVTKQAKILIANSNTQVNGNILPQLNQNLISLNEGLKQVKPLLESAKNQINNPDIDKTVKNMADASVQVKESSIKFNATSGHVEKISADSEAVADHYKKVLTSPATPVKIIFQHIENWSARFLGALL